MARSETVQVGPELKGPLEIDDDAEPEPALVTKNEDYESGTSDGGSDVSGSSSTATVSCHALSSSGEEAIADSVGGRAHGLTSMFSPILAEDIERVEVDVDDGAGVGGSMEASALLLNLSGVTDNLDSGPPAEGARSSSEFNTPDTSPTMPEVDGQGGGGAGAVAPPPAMTHGGGVGAAAPPPATTPPTVQTAEDAAEAGGDEKPVAHGASPARPGRLSNLYQAIGTAFDMKDGDGVGGDERIDRVVNSLARAVANHGAECQGEHEGGASPGAADVDVTSEVAAALRDAGKDVDEVVARIVSLIPERDESTCRAIAIIVQRMNGLIVATAQKNEVFRGASEMHEAAARACRMAEESMLEARAQEQGARDEHELSRERHRAREESMRIEADVLETDMAAARMALHDIRAKTERRDAARRGAREHPREAQAGAHGPERHVARDVGLRRGPPEGAGAHCHARGPRRRRGEDAQRHECTPRGGDRSGGGEATCSAGGDRTAAGALVQGERGARQGRGPPGAR